jgi:hypothetical protein
MEGLAAGTLSDDLGADIESAENQQMRQCVWIMIRTSFCSWRSNLAQEGSLLEWPPFEILLVSSTWNIPLVTLLAGWLCFVAF